MSLLEILVVITIILVLAGIISPLITRTIEQGKNAQCIANLRNIGNGLNLAVADLGYYPGLRPVQFSAGKDRWYQLVQLYLDSNVSPANDPLPHWLTCPSLPENPSRNSEPANLRYLGYGYNKDGFGNTASDPYWQVPLARVQDPHKKILAGDNRDQGGYSTMLYGGVAANQRTYRHQGGGNFLHADGSVHWWRAEDLTAAIVKDRYEVWYPYRP